jgi:ATP synthase protein I
VPWQKVEKDSPMNTGLVVVTMRLLGMGWYVAASLVIFIVGGVWLDGFFGTKPILTLVGLVLGMVVAFGGLYRMVQPALVRVRKDEK